MGPLRTEKKSIKMKKSEKKTGKNNQTEARVQGAHTLCDTRLLNANGTPENGEEIHQDEKKTEKKQKKQSNRGSRTGGAHFMRHSNW